MNHHGLKAQQHWQQRLPRQYAQITDPEAFFTLLGETAQEEIGRLADALAETTPPAEGYLEETARLTTARKMAEMQVTRDMILVDPDDPARIAQLLG
jgi:hypothetical protein